MQFSLISLAAFAASATAQFCGVITSPTMEMFACDVYQDPVMDAKCTALGGTVAGHNREDPGQASNCITYCNNVPTGGHDTTEDKYHTYVVDSCESCGYCGGL